MSDLPATPRNTAATISIASAVVGFLIVPIILGPVAVIAGFLGIRNANDEVSGAAWCGIVAGFAEIIWILVQWSNAGVF